MVIAAGTLDGRLLTDLIAFAGFPGDPHSTVGLSEQFDPSTSTSGPPAASNPFDYAEADRRP